MAYKYSAFISYSNKNLKTASRLKQRLRRFWLPSFMKSDLAKKKRLSIFMADKDFNEHTVISGLHKKLDESEFLVIVCSPDSAASSYCDEEVSYFIRTGRSDKIIPFIISGKANSGDERTECYPRSLRELPRDEQISGIQTTVVGQYAGYLMTAARIMGLEYDSVKYELFRRNMYRAAILTALLLPLICAGIWAVGYYCPRYEYYADYVDRNGLLEGIVPVDKELRSHRPDHYKFEYRKRKLVRVSYENSYGNPIEHGSVEFVERSSVREYQYNARGGLDVVCKNATGQVLWVESINPNHTFIGLKDYETDFGKAVNHSFSDLSANVSSQTMEFNAQQIQKNAKSTIRGYTVFRDQDGYVTKKMFSSSSDNTSSPGHDANGIAGLEFSLDSLHRVETITYLDESGNPTSDHNNVTSRKYSYNAGGNIFRTEFLDENGNPACNENFWATSVVEYNEYSQPVCQKTFDEEGRLCMDQFGIAVTRFSWDDRGMIKEVTGFDDRDEPVNTLPNSSGVPIAHRYCYQYNKEGRVAEIRCYDNKGLLIKYGKTAYVSYEYDWNGNVIKETCHEEDGTVTYGMSAFASLEFDYVANLPYSISYMDTNGRLTNTTGGYAYVLHGFKGGRLVREEYFNKNMNRVPVQILGNACGKKVDYDENTGNITKITYLGSDGMPAPNGQGIEVVSYMFNSRGQCEEERNLSSNGDLKSMFRFEYDKKGNLRKQTYFDAAGEPALHPKARCASSEMIYNDAGRVVEERSLGINSELVTNNQGWSIVRYTYAKGQPYPVALSYYGTQDEPIVATGIGCHEFRRVIRRGQVTEVTYYGTDGAPMLNTRVGAWKQTHDYSPMGLLVKTDLYDVHGNSVNGSDGYCETRWEYDSGGREISRAFYDASKKRARSRSQGFATKRTDYLFTGVVRKISYFDENDDPLDAPEGIHSFECFYDSHLNPYRMEFRDSKGRLVRNSSTGYMAVESIYDPSGACVYQSQYELESDSFYHGWFLFDTLGYHVVSFYGVLGEVKYYLDGSSTEIKVDDDIQLKAAIEKKIRFYKERYAKEEGIKYLFD